MPHASLGPIAVHLPERVETNEDLQREFPRWDLPLIEEKTGIRRRHIAAQGETAADLGVRACQSLFDGQNIDPASIDFLMLCTQTPDYPLPTTSCLMQHRLGLPTRCGAFDFNLGCSGYVYGLAMADGLIQSGAARRVLLVTAETYSKYIDPEDRSLRTIFGDGAAATLIDASPRQTLGGFQFGSDGSGGDMLLVGDGGSRPPGDAIRPRHRKRWKSRLYMDGPSLINFTVDAVPRLIDQILGRHRIDRDGVRYFLMHQATRKMLEQLRLRMGVADERLPIDIDDLGNTVSCTLPILIDRMRKRGELDAHGDDSGHPPGDDSGHPTGDDSGHPTGGIDATGKASMDMLIGFGVGLSWAGCLWSSGGLAIDSSGG